jgi:primary-amine oxidase
MVRYVATLGDYDYTFSSLFYLYGSFDVEVQASGWIIAALGAHNEDYGFLIRKDFSGSMVSHLILREFITSANRHANPHHEHPINFKADSDVLGSNNNVVKVTSLPTTELYPWANGKPRRTMKFNRTTLQSEDESCWDWDGEGVAKGLVVVNEGA